MLRCKNHFNSDHTSSIGVCASCLRQRLLLLHSPPHDPPPPAPAPFVFPRSVSPYISRRKSDTDTTTLDLHRHQRFFSTPQANPSQNKIKKSKFRFFSTLFRSGSSDSRHGSGSNHAQSSSSSASWISAIVGRRKKSTLRLDDTLSRRGRGMSPEEDESNSGYSPESWRRTPSSTRPSQTHRVKASPARSQLASGIGFCLSPLVRPSPSRHWAGLEGGYSGEFRPATGSLRANRSRKLADFGQFNHDR